MHMIAEANGEQRHQLCAQQLNGEKVCNYWLSAYQQGGSIAH
jgi:hypothetical protein